MKVYIMNRFGMWTAIFLLTTSFMFLGVLIFFNPNYLLVAFSKKSTLNGSFVSTNDPCTPSTSTHTENYTSETHEDPIFYAGCGGLF